MNEFADLRNGVLSSDPKTRRHAACRLAWSQEDGFKVLKKVLFGDCDETAKNAAAYGLRRAQGRMRRVAVEIFNEGLKHRDDSTRRVCRDALRLLNRKNFEK